MPFAFPIPHHQRIRAALLSLAFCFAAAAGARAATVFETQNPTHVTLEGSSNLSSWRCRSREIDIRLELDMPLAEINARIESLTTGSTSPQLHPPPRFHLTLPVRSMRCGNRMMDRDVHRSLKMRQHPAIEFTLTGLARGVTHETPGDRYRTAVTGDVSVAGTKRPVTIEVEGWRLAHDAFYLRAKIPMRMTDFGVRPPTALFGLIRARDEITAYFELRVRAQPVGAQ